MAVNEVHYDVNFGDCDPAGMVFYPNIYRWLDRCFHDWLRRFGGHATLCAEFELAGIWISGAEAKFLRPILDGDALVVSIETVDWAEKGLNVHYTGRVGEANCFHGTERRALFVCTPAAIKAGRTEALRAHLETDGSKADGERQ